MLPMMPATPAATEAPAIAVTSNADLLAAEIKAEDQAAIDRAPVVSAIAAHINNEIGTLADFRIKLLGYCLEPCFVGKVERGDRDENGVAR